MKEGLGIVLRAPGGKWLVLVPQLPGRLVRPLQLAGTVALSSPRTESEPSRAVEEGPPRPPCYVSAEHGHWLQSVPCPPLLALPGPRPWRRKC